MFSSTENFFNSLIAMKNALFDFSFFNIYQPIFFIGSAILIFICFYPSYRKLKDIKFKAEVQTILSSLGMTQYTFKSFDKKKRELTLKLSKGEKDGYINIKE